MQKCGFERRGCVEPVAKTDAEDSRRPMTSASTSGSFRKGVREIGLPRFPRAFESNRMSRLRRESNMLRCFVRSIPPGICMADENSSLSARNVGGTERKDRHSSAFERCSAKRRAKKDVLRA